MNTESYKIANVNNKTEEPTIKLRSQKGVVFSPRKGLSYAHHAFICFFKDKFYACFSGGIKNEDDCGQSVMLSTSDDGIIWSEPYAVISPSSFDKPKAVLTASGFYSDGDTLNLYFGYFEYAKIGEDGNRLAVDAHHTKTQLFVLRSGDGITWGKPIGLNLPVVANHPPQATSTGRLIISGSVIFPYTDNPNGVDGWKMPGIYGDAFSGGKVFDDSESIHLVTKANGFECNLICEGSFFESNGVLRMLLRSNSDYLWISESYDNGESWTRPQKTNFTNANAKFHFGKIEKNKFYCINNASLTGDRYPLYLHLSLDGINFNKTYILRDEQYDMQFSGLFKGGAYAYPHSIVHNGYLYVIYSMKKERIEVTKLNLNELN